MHYICTYISPYLYIGSMRPFKLQYLHIYIHTYTQIGYMSAYYVHITNIHLYTIHTHTYADNVCLLYVYTHPLWFQSSKAAMKIGRCKSH